MGSLQALEAIKFILKIIEFNSTIKIFDGKKLELKKFNLKKSINCDVCSKKINEN